MRLFLSYFFYFYPCCCVCVFVYKVTATGLSISMYPLPPYYPRAIILHAIYLFVCLFSNWQP